MKPENLVKLVQHPTVPIVFSFEDDGRTGYGYLHSDDRVVADVWLYNNGDAPDEPDWRERGAFPMPYRNAKPFTRPERPFALPKSEDDVTVQGVRREDGTVGAVISIGSFQVGELFVGDMPGRALSALKDGPLAKVMGSKD